MKKIILTTLSILLGLTIFGQTSKTTANGFFDFNEFKQNKPSLTLEFEVYKRTGGDIFMSGGIPNYRLKQIKPKSEIENVEKEIWGVKEDNSIYINSYPYSKIKGYNLILGKGYYSYFIGEPARNENKQRNLGIIKPTEKQISVCCQVAYVILPDGTVQFLRPKLLFELCKDNKDLIEEIKTANLKMQDFRRMFDLLDKYNVTKKNYL